MNGHPLRDEVNFVVKRTATMVMLDNESETEEAWSSGGECGFWGSEVESGSGSGNDRSCLILTTERKQLACTVHRLVLGARLLLLPQGAFHSMCVGQRDGNKGVVIQLQPTTCAPQQIHHSCHPQCSLAPTTIRRLFPIHNTGINHAQPLRHLTSALMAKSAVRLQLHTS